jgi:hypothetical protein
VPHLPSSLSLGLSDPVQSLGNSVHIEGDFQELQVFLIDSGIDLTFDLGFQNVIDGKMESNPCEGPGPAWIPIDQGFGIEFGAVGIGGSEHNDEVVIAILIGSLLDEFLTLLVKCAGSRSDEALGLRQHRLTACAPDTCLDGRTLNAIPLANNDHFLPFEFHFNASLMAL